MTAAGATTTRVPTPFQRQPRPQIGAVGDSGRHVGDSRSGLRRPVAAARTRYSLLGPLFIVCLALPLYIYVGPARLSPYRILLLASLVPLALIWYSRRAGPIRLPDVLMLLAALWGALALLATTGAAGIEPAAVFFVETFGAYLVARVTIRTYADFYRMVQTLFWLLAIIVPFAVVEAITDRALLHELLRAIASTAARGGNEVRYGLHRASVVFEHPILYGTFCASAFALAYFVIAKSAGPMRRAMRAAVVAAAALCSMSSAPLAAIALQALLMAWKRAGRGIRHPWRLLALLAVLAYFTVDVLSNRQPIDVFISYLTFNSQTGYFRMMIWDYGSAEVLRNPIFGIGLGDWVRPSWMPESVDNFWLLTAMRYGFPGLILFSASIIVMMANVGKVTFSSFELDDARSGLLISLCGLLIAGCTVHFWDTTYVWLIFLVGSGMWMMDAGSKAPEDSSADEVQVLPRQRGGRQMAGLRRS